MYGKGVCIVVIRSTSRAYRVTVVVWHIALEPAQMTILLFC